MNILIMGVAGSGKGTMSAFIKEHFRIPHISTGDMFRENIKQQTELGLLAKQYIDQGHLVPDSVTIGMVAKRLSQPDTENGFLLDGFPRTLLQTGAFERMLRKLNKQLDIVINLDIEFDVLEKRITGRRVCKHCGNVYNVYYSKPQQENVCDNCGNELTHRSDDTVEQLQVRIQEYNQQTKPILDFYRGSGELLNIDAQGEITEVWELLKSKLEQLQND